MNSVTIKAVTAQKNNKVKILLDATPEPIAVLNTDDVVINTTHDDANRLSYLKSAKKAYDDKFKLGLIEGSGGTILEEVNIKSVRRKALQYSSNLNGPGNANQVIYADNLFTGCPTFKDCMAGRMAGVEFNSISGNPVSTRSSLFNITVSEVGASSISIPPGPNDMVIIYDGQFVQPAQVGDFLASLNMSMIATIEVLRSGQFLAIYGSRAGNGVIIITPKRGGVDINMDLVPIPNNNLYPGFVM